MWELHNFESMVCATAQTDKEVDERIALAPWRFSLVPSQWTLLRQHVTYWGSLSASRTLLAFSCWVFLPLLATFFFILILFRYELLSPWILLIMSLVGFFNALNSLSEVGQFCYMLCIISNNSFIHRGACSTSPSRRTSLKEEASVTALWDGAIV